MAVLQIEILQLSRNEVHGAFVCTSAREWEKGKKMKINYEFPHITVIATNYNQSTGKIWFKKCQKCSLQTAAFCKMWINKSTKVFWHKANLESLILGLKQLWVSLISVYCSLAYFAKYKGLFMCPIRLMRADVGWLENSRHVCARNTQKAIRALVEFYAYMS